MHIDINQIPARKAGRAPGNSTTLKAILALGAPATANQIAVAIGMIEGRERPTYQNAYGRIMNLIKTGQVRKLDSGLFVAVEAEGAAPPHNPAPTHAPTPASYSPTLEPAAAATPKRLSNLVVGTVVSIVGWPKKWSQDWDTTFDIGDGETVVIRHGLPETRPMIVAAGFGLGEGQGISSFQDLIGARVQLRCVGDEWSIVNPYKGRSK